MGNKYRIEYRQYKDKCCYEYQTSSLIAALVKLIVVITKYELVDFMYRR